MKYSLIVLLIAATLGLSAQAKDVEVPDAVLVQFKIGETTAQTVIEKLGEPTKKGKAGANTEFEYSWNLSSSVDAGQAGPTGNVAAKSERVRREIILTFDDTGVLRDMLRRTHTFRNRMRGMTQ